MNSEQSFNRRIKRFLIEQPESSASKIIRKIEKHSPHYSSYYNLFDDFTYKLGFGMIADELVNNNFQTIGYILSIKYYPENLLKEEPRIEKLTKDVSPLKLNKCYEQMAKEALYRIMRIPDLDSLITNKL